MSQRKKSNVSANTNREQIEKKLENALSVLKPHLGDKKFKRRIKKAGKMLTRGFKKNELIADKPRKVNGAETTLLKKANKPTKTKVE